MLSPLSESLWALTCRFRFWRARHRRRIRAKPGQKFYVSISRKTGPTKKKRLHTSKSNHPVDGQSCGVTCTLDARVSQCDPGRTKQTRAAVENLQAHGEERTTKQLESREARAKIQNHATAATDGSVFKVLLELPALTCGH